ncbi:putative serine hydrolase-like protein [Dinothrombium tinctorium]|uniref:Putative serine hydrolase-like protein n=1 Tax=Dinothrombium tinctorium TaxID=1965070 RepID=A0A3S3NEL7_9ACAR|nr:putative serine hydrolase-like protein [Dinothrombium tinctorium]
MPSEWIETKIPIQYGYISAKVWGMKTANSIDVVAIHGFLDNCGSFDRLIPLLNEDYYVVAIDLPGHGLSSKLPEGIPYTDPTWIIALQAVLDHFNFGELTLLGHSLGVCIALYYASLFPNRVKTIIALDTILPTWIKPAEIPNEMAKSYKYFNDLCTKKATIKPNFDPSMAAKLVVAAHKMFGELTEDEAKILMQRSTQPTEDGKRVVFTKDDRLNCTLSSLPFKSHFEMVKDYYRRIKCNLLLIRGSKGLVDVTKRKIKETVDMLEKNCESFKSVLVKGGHFFVLTNPEEVAPIIHEFINNLYK